RCRPGAGRRYRSIHSRLPRVPEDRQDFRRRERRAGGVIGPELLARAAAILRAGGLVAFPTETVYGLGANALDVRAVDRVFEVKERPPTSPLIIHVSSVEMARSLAREWPESAAKLAEVFWPGPLTLVVPAHPRIPENVTAGLSTVGLRQPDHPIAAALIRGAGVP